MKTFKIKCYGQITELPESERKAMLEEYHMAMVCCEGSEKERYTKIYFELLEGKKFCSDE